MLRCTMEYLVSVSVSCSKVTVYSYSYQAAHTPSGTDEYENEKKVQVRTGKDFRLTGTTSYPYSTGVFIKSTQVQ